VLLQRGETLYYTHQSRREFWNVATRPANVNGFGLSIEEAAETLRLIDLVFARLPDRPESGKIWDRLVVQYQIIGRAVHDAQTVASMLAAGVTHLLTLNAGDFRRYPEITVVTPGEILAGE